MVCDQCREVMGDLSLSDFDMHAFLAYQDGRYTLAQFNAISASVKALMKLHRGMAAAKAKVTREANNTGWLERYVNLSVKAGKGVPKKLNPTKSNDITTFVINFITWSGGNAMRSNATHFVKDGKGAFKAAKSANKGVADISGGYGGKQLAIEIKNRFTKDKWKEHDPNGRLTPQAIYRDKIIASGGIHMVVTDIENFLLQWDDLINKPGLLF